MKITDAYLDSFKDHPLVPVVRHQRDEISVLHKRVTKLEAQLEVAERREHDVALELERLKFELSALQSAGVGQRYV